MAFTRPLRVLLAYGLGGGGPLLAASTVTVTSDTRWDSDGCNSRDLCECKLHGEVASVKGTDIASGCQDDGYAVPKAWEMYRLHDAMRDRRFQYQCDSLKLNAFCYSQNGCLKENNKAMCEVMKGDSCNVDCNGAHAPSVTAFQVLAVVIVGELAPLLF
mmetsp:Transcript_62284/g.175584  ORF Transcript_62284/g.175584 Transcript_62284/m.175584 type:complete len:159 (+) Transcript_62284:114-590(+)